MHHRAEGDKEQDRENVHRPRDLESTACTERHREGVESLTAVKRLVLRPVHRVERSDPEGDREKEYEHRQLNFPADRNPAARWRHANGDAEEEMYPSCHALHVRVDEEGHRSERQETDADRMHLQHSEDKHKEAHADKDERLLLRDTPLHHRTVGEAGLLLVIL